MEYVWVNWTTKSFQKQLVVPIAVDIIIVLFMLLSRIIADFICYSYFYVCYYVLEYVLHWDSHKSIMQENHSPLCEDNDWLMWLNWLYLYPIVNKWSSREYT